MRNSLVFNSLLNVSVSTYYYDWFLPSKDELTAMYNNLWKDNSIGNFHNDTGFSFYSSTESGTSWAHSMQFSTGIPGAPWKGNAMYVRPSRSFISSASYGLRATGPSGGWIFYVADNQNSTYTYYEAAPADISTMVIWSNLDTSLLGTTSSSIGYGLSNSTAIINQPGHVVSAAKVCLDLSIYS